MVLRDELVNAVKSITTEEEIFEIDKLLRQKLSILRSNTGRTKNFMTGETVWFRKRSGDRIEGKVVRPNKKTVTVDCGFEGMWRIGYTLLHHEGE